MKWLAQLLITVGLSILIYVAFEIHFLLGMGITGVLLFWLGILYAYSLWTDGEWDDDDINL